MQNEPHHDIAVWLVHETEDDCELIIRTSNGIAFYCQILPSNFHHSPQVLEQYFNCLHLFRSREVEIDDFYEEDAYEWLSKAFNPLIIQLASTNPELPDQARRPPTLSQYLFPPYFVCGLAATNEKLQPYIRDTKDHGWRSPCIRVDNEFLADLDRWTKLYYPSDVELCYHRPKDVLIKPPTKVIVRDKNSPTICFFKRFNTSFGNNHATGELIKMKMIALADIPPPPEALVYRLHGVVRDGNELAGMLFTWIDTKEVLCQAIADKASIQLKNRWADQISRSLHILHQQGIIWGDIKAENILIDKDDNAWIIDFGGSYTPGWVDEDKAGTLEGDFQGLSKILNMLRSPTLTGSGSMATPGVSPEAD